MKIINPLSYSKTVIINGKTLCIEWTERAYTALRERKQPLNIEMELYFSSMVKKLVIFHDSHVKIHNKNMLHNVTDKIKVWFHPVTSLACENTNTPHRQPMVDINVNNLHNYYPKKLNIDFFNGHWKGYFR